MAAVGGAAVQVNENSRKRLSMSDVSDMLYEFYRVNANAAKAPKQQPQASVLGAVVAKYCGQTSPTSAETHEPSTIAAIATNGAASETASKNLQSDEMMAQRTTASTQLEAASFHPRLKYTLKKLEPETSNRATVTAIPTSVLVQPSMATVTTSAADNDEEPLDIKPIINPVTGLVMTPIANAATQSVIKPVPEITAANPQAAAIAAALFRDGYHNFQQHIRAQEIIKLQSGKIKALNKAPESTPTKILETFLRQQRHSEGNIESDHNNDDDDEDDSRYGAFEDIHLMDSSKANLSHILQTALASNSAPATPGSTDYHSDESQKYMNMTPQQQQHALQNFKYSLADFGNGSANDNITPSGIGPDGEPIYECRHCGKKYRWKSTLRRHENVECGGKEPSHQCPYCPYKSKQRGNLGVHVRKHHSNLPQLTSKRRSKYSMKFDLDGNSNSNVSEMKYETELSSANVSDDSNSRLIIDCSK